MTSGISSPTSMPISPTSAYSSTRKAPSAPSRQAAVRHEQRGRHQAAHQPHQQFDAQELRDELPLHKAAQPRADAHGKQVAADDGGKLQHRVAQQVAGQRACGQLVDQAAGGHHEDRGQQHQFGRRDAIGVRGLGLRLGGGVGRGAHGVRVTQRTGAAAVAATMAGVARATSVHATHWPQSPRWEPCTSCATARPVLARPTTTSSARWARASATRWANTWPNAACKFEAVLRGSLRRHVQSLAALSAGHGQLPAALEWPGLNEYDGEALVRAIHPRPGA
jgi:hypothetical protein